jgi:hypothetical protein
MSGVRIVLACALVAGCAKGKGGGDPDDPDGAIPPRADADLTPQPDAEDLPDAEPHNEIDAPPGTPDAPPPPPDAMGCTVQQVQLLTNGGFDSGVAPWVESGLYPIIGAPPTGVTAISAPNVAWMAGYDDAVDRTFQDVAIPATATAIVFQGFLRIDTQESGGVYDTATVELRSTADGLLATLGSWDNNDAASLFISQSLPSPSAFAGQTIRVDFHADTDVSLPTSFFWDSAELLVTACL